MQEVLSSSGKGTLCPENKQHERCMVMTNLLKFLLLAMALVAGNSLAVAAPKATHYQAPRAIFTDQSSGYQPVSPPPWAW
jgi:hypothetical protein